MNNNIYMILLVDRRKARMFTMFNGAVDSKVDYTHGQVHKRIKSNGERWKAQDKIFRHIEENLHKHLRFVGNKAALYAKQNHIANLIVGSHNSLFTKINKYLPYPLRNNVKGKFVTELKGPFNQILKRANYCIRQIEKKNTPDQKAPSALTIEAKK